MYSMFPRIINKNILKMKSFILANYGTPTQCAYTCTNCNLPTMCPRKLLTPKAIPKPTSPSSIPCCASEHNYSNSIAQSKLLSLYASLWRKSVQSPFVTSLPNPWPPFRSWTWVERDCQWDPGPEQSFETAKTSFQKTMIINSTTVTTNVYTILTNITTSISRSLSLFLLTSVL